MLIFIYLLVVIVFMMCLCYILVKVSGMSDEKYNKLKSKHEKTL